jgi:hypothetical protein
VLQGAATKSANAIVALMRLDSARRQTLIQFCGMNFSTWSGAGFSWHGAANFQSAYRHPAPIDVIAFGKRLAEIIAKAVRTPRKPHEFRQ